MENEIYTQLNSKYNLNFIEKLRGLDGISIYVFGGMPRDLILNREWKEADIRIVYNKNREKREADVENALKEYDLQGKTQIEALNLTVYRFLPSDSNNTEPIDLSLVPTLDDNLPDFTINSIYFDLVEKKLVDRFNGVGDLDSKLIRTVKSPDQQFKEEPHMIFRAIKFACQLNFSIEKSTYESIKKLSSLAQQTLNFISDTKKGIFVELFLGNIFKGLKSNPKKYFEFIKELGIYDEFIRYASLKTRVTTKQVVYPIKFYGDFEKDVSYLLSCVIDSISVDEPKTQFEMLASDLAITTPKDYSDFKVNIDKIRYLG